MLEVKGLSKRYDETVALEDVTLTFTPGLIHAILGENGSGKSTLVKLLSGVVRQSAGTIRIGGRLIAGEGPAEIQALGLATVFQEVLLAPDRSVTDNILVGMGAPFGWRAPRAERRRLAAKMLARITRTPIDLDAVAGSLSLAVGQLVVLARALARRPTILILDEVTAALDLPDREGVFQMMEGHVRAGGLILFISHRMDEVLRLADRVTILRNGRVVDTLERSGVTAELLLRLMAPAAAEELAHGR
ncbi:MAG: ATP-binding cassette domain-containing protein [Roseiarcus sp.]|jgi:ribose transport system ATP-binding protein